MAQKTIASKKFLTVKIAWSPIIGKQTMEERALAVSSQNLIGNFDILPDHVNFISLILNNLTLHLLDRKVDYQFGRGLLEVSENRVNVFLGV